MARVERTLISICKVERHRERDREGGRKGLSTSIPSHHHQAAPQQGSMEHHSTQTPCLSCVTGVLRAGRSTFYELIQGSSSQADTPVYPHHPRPPNLPLHHPNRPLLNGLFSQISLDFQAYQQLGNRSPFSIEKPRRGL